MPIPPSILILGAGELGTSVLEALSRHPKHSSTKLSILLRKSTIETQDPSKRKQNTYLRSLNASLEPGDLASDSIAELAAVFKRFHTVVSCSGFGLPPGTQTKITRAALAAGVARYVPWQWGIDYDVVGQGSAQDLFDEQLSVRALLRAQDAVGWSIVSTGLFMSFLFKPEFGVVDLEGRKVRALGGWEGRLSVTTAGDIGRVAAEMLLDPREGEEGVVYVAGDTVSYSRIKELVKERFGGEWVEEVWDEEFLKGELRKRPDDGMLKYTNVWAVGKGVAWDMGSTVNRRRGIELQNLESYLRDMPDL
ncbi:NAD(P)-binding protein [Annulohypoxylon maeteangense]|uniref:NAD(P)-binding protein n=1 Tax=Annulohypoxylon maeteangense TaxID=1927788 RepID=UPI002007CF4A|nr:NAD(P)-binding protein [Annulohypoxylon maeteangense]KAI0880809.1 NAD(P)-binding protein [Annulohypoxylon maeteangense]